MRTLNRSVLVLTTVALLSAAVAPAARADQVTADPFTLADLLGSTDPFLLADSGRVRFDNFEYGPGLSGITADQIAVELNEVGDEVQLVFHTGLTAMGGEVFEMRIEYDVTSTDPLVEFTGHELTASAGAFSNGLATVTDTLTDPGDNPLANQLIAFNDQNPAVLPSVSNVNFASPQSSFHVNKGLRVVGGDQLSAINHADQTVFLRQIPEPASAVLLLIGAVGAIMMFGRRRS